MKTVAAALFLAVAAVGAHSMPVGEPEAVRMDDAIGERVVLSGTVERFGNEPHTFLGILVTPDAPPRLDASVPRPIEMDRERVFRLEGERTSELDQFQGRRLTIRGILTEVQSGSFPPLIVEVESYEPESN